MSDHSVGRMLININGLPDSDQVELDSLTLELRERLLELDVDRVDLVGSDKAPDGAKVGISIAFGSLIVFLSVSAVKKALDLLNTWIQSRPVRTVNVTIGENTIELEAVSRGDQQRLIDLFIAATESDGTATDPSESV